MPHGTCNVGGHGCKMGQGGKRGQNGRRGEFFCSSTHILTALITMGICNVGYLQQKGDNKGLVRAETSKNGASRQIGERTNW